MVLQQAIRFLFAGTGLKEADNEKKSYCKKNIEVRKDLGRLAVRGNLRWRYEL